MLHPDLASRFAAWTSAKGHARDELLFPVSGKVPGGVEQKTSKMMKNDLQSARMGWIAAAESADEQRRREQSDFLKYRDANGCFADFHANRHTFITILGRAGVSPKTLQELARHSDVRLTLGVYSHTDLLEKAAAIARLPPAPHSKETGARSTRNSSPESDGNSNGAQHSGSAPEAQTGSACRSATKNGEAGAPANRGNPSPEPSAVSGS